MIERYSPELDLEAEASDAPDATELHGAGVRQPLAPVPAVSPPVEEVADEPEAKSFYDRFGHWAAWSMSMVVIGVLVGGAIIGVMRFVNGPVEVTAKADPLEAARKSVAPKPTTNRLAGQWVELTYPSVFDQVGDVRKVAGAFDEYFISSKGNTSRAITVSVEKLESGKIDDHPSYRYRQINPQDYGLKTTLVASKQSGIMTKHDKTESTLFAPYKGKVLIISITSIDKRDNVPEYINRIIPTIRWRQ